MNTNELLQLAETLTDEQAGKMAHALGWPHHPSDKWKRVRWANPYRNYYCAGEDPDPEWEAAHAAGLAGREPVSVSGQDRYVYWRVTPKGQAVLRVWLLARRMALKEE